MVETADINIKEYITNSRKNGFPDSKIIENLKKSNWPDDIIQQAVNEADQIIQKNPEEESKDLDEEFQKLDEKNAKEEHEKKIKNDLFTKPPEDIVKPEKTEEPKEEKKTFSIMAVFALIFSPIPGIGFGLAMGAINNIQSKKQKGMVLAVLALLINLLVFFMLGWYIYQIFSLNPDQLSGLAKRLNEMFKLV